VDISVLCGKAAAGMGVEKFIQVSTAQVYDYEKKGRAETDKLKPWTALAEAHLKAEQELAKVTGLKMVIVRPAIVYGPGDINGLTPRIIIGAVYKATKEKMEFLWDGDLNINTVHVSDVVRALWFLAAQGKAGDVFNLADTANSNQGSIAELLEKYYSIKCGFKGNLASKLATSIAMKTVAEAANEMHLKPWSDVCKMAGITNSPLTPYLDEELLYNHPLSVNGVKITTLGFKYEHPAPTLDDIKAVVAGFQELAYFPKEIKEGSVVASKD